MNRSPSLDTVRRTFLAAAFLLYPLCAGIAFAVHPNLLSLNPSTDVADRIAEFHGNAALHLGHVLMLVGAGLLVAVAVHFDRLLRGTRSAWWGYLGGLLAIGGAVVLAADKGALCLVPSAFDTLPGDEFRALGPGLEAMFGYQGWLWVLRLLPVLPVGFALQAIGLVRSAAIPRRQGVPILVGAVLMANPDIDLIGLAATACLAFGFLPYAWGSLLAPRPGVAGRTA